METWNSLLSLTKGMIKMSKIYYLAYGSNLNKNQMAYRCPNAKTIGSMMLKGYELVFKSCLTIEPNKDGEVPLGIWQITKEDEKRLDRYEGYPILYRKEYIDIVIEGENSIIQKGPYAYYGIHQAGDGAVYSRYGDGSLYIETPGNGIENVSEMWVHDCSITIRTGNQGINSFGTLTFENCAIDIESTSGNFNNMINCYSVVDIQSGADIRLVTTTPYSNALYASGQNNLCPKRRIPVRRRRKQRYLLR